MMQKIRWAILIFGVLVLIAVMVQNSHPVILRLFFFETELPTSILLLATSVLSFLIGALTTGRLLGRRGTAARRVKHAPTAAPLKSGPS